MTALAIEQLDCVVIGAGVVGLAVARAFALAGREVVVLEAANAMGTGTSSRNSEVIHAGIYYPAGSLKAQLCVQGNRLLYAYCAERGIGHRRCGKLIVATSDAQVASLQGYIEKARANGVHDLRMLTAAEALALEPALSCKAAVLSPSTGIVDSHGLMLSYLGDIENAGGILVLNTAVSAVSVSSDAIIFDTEDGARYSARTLINAAGLMAPALAGRMAGLAPQHVPPTFWAKGNYFTLAGKSPFGRLIYPVANSAGLGVHLTVDLGGQAKFGPDVQWVDSPDDLQVDPARGDAFYAEVRKYWPDLPDGALQAGYAGIRPKLTPPNALASDFVMQGPLEHGVPGLVNLFGIESPGLTASLALAERVVAMGSLTA